MCVGGGGGGGRGGESGLAVETDTPPPPPPTHTHTHTCCIFFLALRSHFLHSGHIHSAIYLQKVHILPFDSSSWNFYDLFLLFHTDADEKCGMWVNLGRGDVRVGF